ncbi:MAG: sigma-70 family RNA polymerase sigma factor [Thermoguttaceae bacterium]|nr:sigma-70 family RNA polymerase sigma factor [Thermoguttaceae bacterium]
MTASNDDDRFGLSPEEYRRLIDAFKNATTPEERVQIFKKLLNDDMYAEFATVARRYKRETGALPDVETYSVVNKYVNDVLKWWYDDPEKILRFEELEEFVAYSRDALWWALLKKLQPSKGKGKGSELTGQEDAPEPSVADSFIAEIVGQDAFDELIRQIKEILTELELDVFLKRALDGLSFPEIARLLSERSDPPKTYAADQVRAIYNRALKKIRRRLGDWGNGAFV